MDDLFTSPTCIRKSPTSSTADERPLSSYQVPLPQSPPPLPLAVVRTRSTSAPKQLRPIPEQVPLPLSPQTNFSAPFYPASPTRTQCDTSSGLPLSPRHEAPSSLPALARNSQVSPISRRGNGLNAGPAPDRPPRPQCSLPDLRPIVVLSPEWITALPPCDRPPGIRFEDDPLGFGDSFSSSSDNLLPSPTFFQPRSWSAQASYRPVYDHNQAHAGAAGRRVRGHPRHQRSGPSAKPPSPTKHSAASSTSSSSASPVTWQWAPISPTSCSRDSGIISALPVPPGPAPDGPLPQPPSPPRRAATNKTADETLHHQRSSAEEKIPVSTLPPHLQPGVTEDITEPPEPPTWRRRHRRKMHVLATVILILVLTAGILGGIMWRLAKDDPDTDKTSIKPLNVVAPTQSGGDEGPAAPTAVV